MSWKENFTSLASFFGPQLSRQKKLIENFKKLGQRRSVPTEEEKEREVR